MHSSRLLSLVGVIVMTVSLFLISLATDGESYLAGLHDANPDIPGGIPTLWGGLDVWEQVLAVVLLVAAVVLALLPPIRAKFNRMSAVLTALIGLALLASSVVKFLDAGDKADELAGVFGQLNAAGAVPEAFAVGRGVGFVVLFVGCVLVIFGGSMGFVGIEEEQAAE